MISVVVTLAIVGFLLWVLQNYVPMDARIKTAIYVVVLVCVVFWLINIFGLMNYDVPIPRLSR
jgi:hypothetical protein